MTFSRDFLVAVLAGILGPAVAGAQNPPFGGRPEILPGKFRHRAAIEVRAAARAYLDQLDSLPGTSWQVLSDPDLGNATWISVAVDESRPSDALSGGTADDALKKFLAHASGLWHVGSVGRSTLREVKRQRDEFGEIHARYQQDVGGIPVFGGDVILHARKLTGSARWAVHAAGGNLYPIDEPTLGSPTTSALAELAAVRVLRDRGWLGARAKSQWIFPIDGDYVVAWEVEQTTNSAVVLAAHPEVAFIRADDATVLAVTSTTNHGVASRTGDTHLSKRSPNHSNVGPKSVATASPSTQAVSVTATGIDLFNHRHYFNSTLVGSEYYLKDAGYIQHVWVYDNGGEDTAVPYDSRISRDQNNDWDFSSQRSHVSGVVNGGRSVQYFHSQHGRDGMTGSQNGPLKVLVNLGNNKFDAGYSRTYRTIGFFNGGENLDVHGVGFGSATSLPLVGAEDIVLHEFTHGVLYDEGAVTHQTIPEVNAMEEALADYFGASYRNSSCLADTVITSPAYTPDGTPIPPGCARDIEVDVRVGDAFYERYRTWPTGAKFHLMGIAVSSALWDARKYITTADSSVYDKIVYRAIQYYVPSTPSYLALRQAVVRAAMDLEGNNTVPNNIPIAFFTEREFWDNNIGPKPFNPDLSYDSYSRMWCAFVEGPPNSSFQARMLAGTGVTSDENVTPLLNWGALYGTSTDAGGYAYFCMPAWSYTHTPGDGHYHAVRITVSAPENTLVGSVNYFDSDLYLGSRRDIYNTSVSKVAGGGTANDAGVPTSFSLGQSLGRGPDAPSLAVADGQTGEAALPNARARLAQHGITSLKFAVPARASGANEPRMSTAGAASTQTDGDARRIRITIYDLGGRVVRRAVDHDFAPGLHHWQWDLMSDGGRRVPAGSYVAIMVAEKFRARSVLVVR